jgi:hypothetical protein
MLGDSFEGGIIVVKIIYSVPKIDVFSHSYSKYTICPRFCPTLAAFALISLLNRRKKNTFVLLLYPSVFLPL